MSQDQPDWLHKRSESARHKIRLHGPWHFESVGTLGDVSAAGSIKIPSDWSSVLGTDFRGRVLFKRRFGMPSNLDADERIDLVLEKINGTSIVRLNNEVVGSIAIAADASRFDISTRLQQRNELQVEVDWSGGDSAGESGGIVGEVYLEIYEVAL